jgi:hypothetical protein
MTHDPFGHGLNSRGTFSVQFCPFRTESVLSEQLSLKLMLISNNTYLGEEYYTEDVINFDTLSASINTPSPNKSYRSNVLWKSGVLLEFSSFLDRSKKLIHFGV